MEICAPGKGGSTVVLSRNENLDNPGKISFDTTTNDVFEFMASSIKLYSTYQWIE